MFSTSTHLPENVIISLSFTAEYNSIVYMHHIFNIHPPVDGRLSCFHFLTIVNRATMNTDEQVYLW